MGRTVPVRWNGEVSNLGSSVESVVIDRIRTGRVLALIAGPSDVASERSVLEARRGNYSIRHGPGALSVPLGAVLEMRVSMKNQRKGPIWPLTYGIDPSGLVVDRAEASSLVSENWTGLADG